MWKLRRKKNGSCGFGYHIGAFPTLLPQLLSGTILPYRNFFLNIPELCTPPILHQTSGQVQVPPTRDDDIYLNNKLGGLLAKS